MEQILGVMLDCSRNAVLKVDTVKHYADVLKKMGYNTLMLYTEDTYEVNNQPYFGHLRGRYTKEELKELDRHCLSIGIELIPCIQTLAHLATIFKWEDEYGDINDCDAILLCGEEKTYKLIDDMFATISECFATKKIHIGMDEAHRLGTGQYQVKNGHRERFDIINEHLHKVCEIADKYNLEPMIWHDMFYRLALNTETQYDDGDVSKLLERAKLPKNISLVFWEYFSTDSEYYEKKIEVNKLFDRKVYFAGTAQTWRGFAPSNSYSININNTAVKACTDAGVEGMFFTVWGDDGAECPHFAALPALLHAAEVVKGNTDLDSIKAKFKEITGCSYDSFMLFEKLDMVGGKHRFNPCKYLLYNDVFLGFWDYKCSDEDDTYYKNLAEQIKNAPEKGEFGYIFDMYEALADVLSVKASYGINLRKAYLARDIDALKKEVENGELIIEKLKAFHSVFQKRWFKDNKPHGFEIQDIRLGGLSQRVQSCINRVKLLIDGEITDIPELDEPVLEKDKGFFFWGRIISPNVVTNKV